MKPTASAPAPAPASIAPSAPRTTSPRSLVLGLVGSGGDGVALLGDLVLGMAARQGLYGMMVQSYGPQIRGGESAAIVRIAESEVLYEGDQVDVLLCFRLRDLKRFQGSLRLHTGSVVIIDREEAGDPPEWLGRTEEAPYRFPFARFEEGLEVEGPPKNMLGLGLLCRVLGWPQTLAEDALRRRFGHRRERLQANLEALATGLTAEQPPERRAPAGRGHALFAETGNEAIARGAIAAGLKFFAGYPITPSSEVMETLIEELPAAGGRVVQAEDEIAAMGMVLGASFGGVPSMTATSGPGLSLMTEMIGLSSMAELPAVIVDCQRAGPATGMPSRTEQSDLYHAVYGGHGDFPRAVLGVFDVVHGRDVMYRAMLVAERYQLPVLVLSDAYIAQRRQIRDAETTRREAPARERWTEASGPARFDLTSDEGVNAFRVPGDPGGTYLAAGIEHTAEGFPTADTAMHQRMNEKRFRKLEAIARDSREWYRTLGAASAPKGIVAWGSAYGLLREWVAARPEYRVFLPEIIHPFPLEAFESWRRGLSSLAVVEMNFQGQFHRYLSSLTDLRDARRVTRSGGTPMTAAELDRYLTEATV
ncbi:MAG TPA: 2-oxoacid:acceptor oxidoreductase family protein [Candidatus Eisenbacteria bacterium]|nr:2-oxoacid:acceptor oxidoreductase family protein [Candidatus Eisenbacteria bacterium]